jgi:hypothetical protein
VVSTLFGFASGGPIQPTFYTGRVNKELDPLTAVLGTTLDERGAGLLPKKAEEYKQANKSRILKVPFGTDRFGMVFIGASGEAGLGSQALVPLKSTKLNTKLYDRLSTEFDSVLATFDKHIASTELTTDFNRDVTEQLKVSIGTTLKKAMKGANVDLELTNQQMATITGPVFEKYLSALIGIPLESANNAVFDFTDSRLKSSKINEMVFPKLQTSLIDVKLSGHGENVYSVIGKYLNYKNQETGGNLGSIPTAEGTDVAIANVTPGRSRGGARRPRVSGEDPDAERIRREAESIGLAEIIKRPLIKQFSRGGSTDTVPALLTPGEFIMSRDAVSRLGTSNLSYMNVTGKVPGFALGGLVDDNIITDTEIGKRILAGNFGPFEFDKLLTSKGVDTSKPGLFKEFNRLKGAVSNASIPVATVPKAYAQEVSASKSLFVSGDLPQNSSFSFTRESALPYRVDEHKELIEQGFQNQATRLAQIEYVRQKQANKLPDLTPEQKVPVLLSDEAKGKTDPEIGDLLEKEQRRLFVEQEVKKQRARIDAQVKSGGINRFTGSLETGLEFYRASPQLTTEEVRRQQESARRGAAFGQGFENAPAVDIITARTQKEIDRKGGSDVLSSEKQQELFNEQRKRVIQELIASEQKRIRANIEGISSEEALRIARENVANGLVSQAKIDTKGGTAKFTDAEKAATARLNEFATAAGKNTEAQNKMTEAISGIKPKGGFSDFLERRGIGGEGTLIGEFGKLFGGGSAGSGGGLSRIAGFGALGVAASTYVPQIVNELTPRFDERLALAVNARGELNPDLLRRTGGQISAGATTGATFGIAAGAIGLGGFGAAIGFAVGAIKGFTEAVYEQERQITKVQLAKSLEYFATQLSDFNIGKVLPTGDAISRLNQSFQSTLVRFRADESESRRGGFFSADTSSVGAFLTSGPYRIQRDTRLALSSEDRSLRESLGPRLPDLLQNQERITTEYLRQAGVRLASGGGSITDIRGNPSRFSGQVDEVFNRFIEENSGYGRSILELTARLRSIPLDEARRQLREAITLQLRQNIITQQEIENRSQVNARLRNFSGIIQAFQGAVISLHQFQATTDLIADTLEGRFSPVKSNLAERASVTGGLDRRFLNETIEAVTSPLGEHGDRLRTDITQVDNAFRLLPGLLAQTASTRPLDDKEFGVRVGAQLRGAGFASEIVTAITNNIDKMKPEELFQRLRQDISGLSRDLLKDFEPVRQAFTEVAKAIDEIVNQFRAGLQRNNVLIGSVQQTQFRGSESTLARQRVEAENLAIGAGRRSDVLRFVTLQQQEAPFNERQRILAGSSVGNRFNDVGELSTALQRTIRQIQEQDVIQRRSPASPEGIQAAVRFAELTRTSQDLQNALRNLADTSTRAAATQERLSELQQDRESRLSFGERFISSDTAQQQQIIRSIQLTQLAAQRGSVQGFADTDRRAIFELLNSMGSARIPGIGGISARDLREQFVSEFAGGLFRPTEGARTEEQSLRDRLGEMFRTREAAEQALYENLRALQTSFFDRLIGANNALLAGLERNLQVSQQDLIRTRFQEAQTALGPATERRDAAVRLRQISPELRGEVAGVTPQAAFSRILANIETFRQLRTQLEINRSTENPIPTITGIGTGLRFREGFTGGPVSVNDTNVRELLFREQGRLGLNDEDVRGVLTRTFDTDRLNRIESRIRTDRTPEERDTSLRSTFSGTLATQIRDAVIEARRRAGDSAETLRGRLRERGIPEETLRGFEGDPARFLELLGRFSTGEEFGTAITRFDALNTTLETLRDNFNRIGGIITGLDERIRAGGGPTPATTAPLTSGVPTVVLPEVPRPSTRIPSEPTEVPPIPGTIEARTRTRTESGVFTRLRESGAEDFYGRSSFDPARIGDFIRFNVGRFGSLFEASGGLIPNTMNPSHRLARGTDTVPAMLTPGEYVINREATERNLPLLEAINRGGASYLARGGIAGAGLLNINPPQRVNRGVANRLLGLLRQGTTTAPVSPDAQQGLFDTDTYTTEEVSRKFSTFSDADLNESVEQARAMMLNLLTTRRQTFSPEILSLPRAITGASNNLVRAQLTSRLSRIQEVISKASEDFQAMSQFGIDGASREDKLGIISRLPRTLLDSLKISQGVRSTRLATDETLDEASLKREYQNRAVPFIEAVIAQSTRMIGFFNARQGVGEFGVAGRNDALRYWQGIFDRFSDETNYPRSEPFIRAINAGLPIAGVEQPGRRNLLNILREASLGFVPIPRFTEDGGLALDAQVRGAGELPPGADRALEVARPQLARAALLTQIRAQDLEARESNILDSVEGNEAALNPRQRIQLLRLRQQRAILQGQVGALAAQTITPQEIEGEQRRRTELGQEISVREEELRRLFTELPSYLEPIRDTPPGILRRRVQQTSEVVSSITEQIETLERRDREIEALRAPGVLRGLEAPELDRERDEIFSRINDDLQPRLDARNRDVLLHTQNLINAETLAREKQDEYNTKQNELNNLRTQLREISGGPSILQRRIAGLGEVAETVRLERGRGRDTVRAIRRVLGEPELDLDPRLLEQLRRGITPGVRAVPRVGQPGVFVPSGPRTPEEWEQLRQTPERRAERREFTERARALGPRPTAPRDRIETDPRPYEEENPEFTTSLNDAIRERNDARRDVNQLIGRIRGLGETPGDLGFTRQIGIDIDTQRQEFINQIRDEFTAISPITGEILNVPDEQEIGAFLGSREDQIRAAIQSSTNPQALLISAREVLTRREQTLREEIDRYRDIRRQAGPEALRAIGGFNTGGPVPGVGNTDTVPAMLTPGEFVINAQAASRFGIENLHRINYLQRGGAVRGTVGTSRESTGLIIPNEAISELSSSLSSFTSSSTALSEAMRSFSTGANSLTEALNKFPRSIEGSFSHNVNVIMNGLEVLSTLQVELQDIAVRAAKDVLRKYIDENMPDAGRPL